MLIFFFNDTATTEIYTLSLHDALPISRLRDALHARKGPALVDPVVTAQLFNKGRFLPDGERIGAGRCLRGLLVGALFIQRPTTQVLRPLEGQIQITVAEPFLKGPANGGDRKSV